MRLLSAVDSFVFPFRNTASTTVIDCLTTLLGLFGLLIFFHNDRGASFVSKELMAYLKGRGVQLVEPLLIIPQVAYLPVREMESSK